MKQKFLKVWLEAVAMKERNFGVLEAVAVKERNIALLESICCRSTYCHSIWLNFPAHIHTQYKYSGKDSNRLLLE
jgi:hypothetical protein